MRLLLFSDVHRDLAACAELVSAARGVDVVIGAGDFASQHRGLEETIDALAMIETPTLLVPGNNETEEALRDTCAMWAAARVLHGEPCEISGMPFYGVGGGIPTTPWSWSFDLDEHAARAMLVGCPEGAILVTHSPPQGVCDKDSSGKHLGSVAIADTIEARRPPLVVCGHIHESWGRDERLGVSRVINAGPRGVVVDLDV
ncbi:MAG: metallophosphoesterase family protein [Phycisphaerales bacterium]